MVDSLKQYPHLLNPQKQQIDKTYLTIKNKIQESGLNSVKPWTNSNQETSDENIFVKNRNTNIFFILLNSYAVLFFYLIQNVDPAFFGLASIP